MGWSSYDEMLWEEERDRWRPQLKAKDQEIEKLKLEIEQLKDRISNLGWIAEMSRQSG